MNFHTRNSCKFDLILHPAKKNVMLLMNYSKIGALFIKGWEIDVDQFVGLFT